LGGEPIDGVHRDFTGPIDDDKRWWNVQRAVEEGPFVLFSGIMRIAVADQQTALIDTKREAVTRENEGICFAFPPPQSGLPAGLF
jgi:hypothetical protein